MAKFSISVQFNGGEGFLQLAINRGGNRLHEISFDRSGSQSVSLDDGLYLMSATGVSPLGGTVITFSELTVPKTPDNISAGPIFRAYSLGLPGEVHPAETIAAGSNAEAGSKKSAARNTGKKAGARMVVSTKTKATKKHGSSK